MRLEYKRSTTFEKLTSLICKVRSDDAIYRAYTTQYSWKSKFVNCLNSLKLTSGLWLRLPRSLWNRFSSFNRIKEHNLRRYIYRKVNQYYSLVATKRQTDGQSDRDSECVTYTQYVYMYCTRSYSGIMLSVLWCRNSSWVNEFERAPYVINTTMSPHRSR